MTHARASVIDPGRIVADLDELERLAPERTAWSHDWQRACSWLEEKARLVGADTEIDRAGNQWFVIPGERESRVTLGGHLDTGAGGGSGGTLSLLAGLEVLRRAAGERFADTIALVNWADGEGTRFGRPFGASAAAGMMRDWFVAADFTDSTGARLLDVVQNVGVEPRFAHMARRTLLHTKAYAEVSHADVPQALVATAAEGIERCRLVWRPGEEKQATEKAAAFFTRDLAAIDRDALHAKAQVRLVADRAGTLAGQTVQQFDAAAGSSSALAEVLELALDSAEGIALAEASSVEWLRLWKTSPVELDPALAALAADALRTTGAETELGPTPLQAAATELARGGWRTCLVLLAGEGDRSASDQAGLAGVVLERIARHGIEGQP